MLSSFVIGFHSARSHNLFQTLKFLNKWHSEVVDKSQLVLICQDELRHSQLSANIFEEIRKFRSYSFTDLRLPCMQLPKITNLGITCSLSDKIIILESDRILPQGYFAEVIDQLKPGIQITCRHMRKLAKEATDVDIETGIFESTCDDRNANNEIGIKNIWSGNTAICKSDFYKAGKMDETYVGYGWADSDMTCATEAAGIQSVFRNETELHLWHPGATYGLGDQKEMFLNNGLYYCKKWKRQYNEWFANELMQARKMMI